MYALFRQLGYDGPNNRDQRHQVMTAILSRKVGSTKELSGAELAKVIGALDARAKERSQQQRRVG